MDKFDYNNSSDELFTVETIEEDVPVTCLGKDFKNDKERKEYFLGLLAEKLKDPEFRKIEGFPIGSDEDILALSDPPYYCACPNPWINDLIMEWESQKPQKPANWVYKREPYVSDVSEGKKDPIYNAHSYHTKVPHKAIMRYILHYTEPGDIVFDGFAGTGMTGVAAQFCGVKEEIESLGYTIDSANRIHSKDIVSPISNFGARNAIISDLSPIATFISFLYNTPVDTKKFEKRVEEIFLQLKEDFSWMYDYKTEDNLEAIENYTVWSDVFSCPNCGNEIVFFDVAVDRETGRVADEFSCPHCNSKQTKKSLQRVYTTEYNVELGKQVHLIKKVPVLVNITCNGCEKDSDPSHYQIDKIKRIQEMDITHWVPTDELPIGDKTYDAKVTGIEHVNLFYTRRNLIVLSRFFALAKEIPEVEIRNTVLSIATGTMQGLSKQQRFRLFSTFPNMILSGTLYVGSLMREWNCISWLEGKFKSIKKLKQKISQFNMHYALSANSCTDLKIKDNSIDYIFLDPPFGANLMYSELNYVWESWIKIKTNNVTEAIENKTQNKNVYAYSSLMAKSFSEAFRILKPGHWMTVEFSNTNSAVWNGIQTALTNSGFIIACVNALDKKQGSFNAITSVTAVKQDLVITAYKPDSSFTSQIGSSSGEDGVWTFIRKHLEYLPVVKERGTEHKSYIGVQERDPRILNDSLVSYYVGHNILLPISSPDFISELPKHFVERDGLYYLPEQAAKYDSLKAQGLIGDENNTGSLFVHDESSAIAWIREQLKKKTMTTGEMTPIFMQELNSWDKNEKRLELAELLEENFLRYDGIEDVPSPIHSYLSTNYKELRNMNKDNPALVAKAKGRWYVPDPNKQADLEKLREKGLLKEFNGYLQIRGKLKEFRLEAVRAGFKKAWSDKDYKLILDFASRIPSNIIEEDPKLLMWYNGALTRLEK